ncbi:MAG TPA: acetyl-CoA carboxylase biotin carboxyl carrier protein subunit [Ktedonobacterales bacterium]
MARERTGEPARPQPRAPGHGVNIAELRQLVSLMQNSDIEEITIERDADALRLHLRKPASGGVHPLDMSGVTIDAETHGETGLGGDDASQTGADTFGQVTAPLVGRFHVGSKPGAKPLVAVGDVVRQGQTIGSIETLNVFNEVEACIGGRVAEVHVAEGQPVEYGQLLISIQPHGV